MTNVVTVVDIASFFFRKLSFGDGVLTVFVGNDVEDHAEITFEYVRTFFFLKESDFYNEFRQYRRIQLISGNERTLGVYRLTQGAILEKVLSGRLDAEEPQYFFVSTPDECLEVAGFSEPTIRLLARQTQTTVPG